MPCDFFNHATGDNVVSSFLQELHLTGTMLLMSKLSVLPKTTKKLVITVEALVRDSDVVFQHIEDLRLTTLEEYNEFDFADKSDDFYDAKNWQDAEAWPYVLKSIVKCFPKLRRLSLTCAEVDPLSDHWLTRLGSLAHLESLRLTGFAGVCGAFVASGFPTLVDVSFRDCPLLMPVALRLAKQANPALSGGRVMVLPHRTDDNDRYVL